MLLERLRDRVEGVRRIESKKPLIIGTVPNPRAFSKPLDHFGIYSPKLQNRVPNFGLDDYLSQFLPTLEIIFTRELQMFGFVCDPSTFLIDQRPVRAGSTARVAGPHLDPYERLYSTTDFEPTKHYIQTFKVRRGQFDQSAVAAQADPSKMWQDDSPKSYDIVLSGPSNAHESPIIPKDTPAGKVRTYLAVGFGKVPEKPLNKS